MCFLFGCLVGTSVTATTVALWRRYGHQRYRQWRDGICTNFIRQNRMDSSPRGWAYPCRTCGHPEYVHLPRR